MRQPDLSRLQAIMAKLRASDGCPWDREQTLASLKPFLLEEAYEVLDVMDSDDPELHREELGDLLFQVVFHAQLRAEQGAFELADVVDEICEKLTRRHPHVFGGEDGGDSARVAERWEELKSAEGKGRIEDVPRSLPALIRAQKIGKKASKVGFDWQDIEGPLAKLDEEVEELKVAIQGGQAEAVFDELGDVLFAAVNVARHSGVEPELALRATTDRFLRRFLWVRNTLEDRGVRLGDPSIGAETLDILWEEAKQVGESGA